MCRYFFNSNIIYQIFFHFSTWKHTLLKKINKSVHIFNYDNLYIQFVIKTLMIFSVNLVLNSDWLNGKHGLQIKLKKKLSHPLFQWTCLNCIFLFCIRHLFLNVYCSLPNIDCVSKQLVSVNIEFKEERLKRNYLDIVIFFLFKKI